MDFVVPPLVRAAVTGSPLIGPMERPLRCNGRTPSCPTVVCSGHRSGMYFPAFLLTDLHQPPALWKG